VSKDILESHLDGPIILKKFMMRVEFYLTETENNYSHLTNMVFEQNSGFQYREQSSKRKHGSIMSRLSTQYY
jgi:hypothetical protein